MCLHLNLYYNNIPTYYITNIPVLVRKQTRKNEQGKGKS